MKKKKNTGARMEKYRFSSVTQFLLFFFLFFFFFFSSIQPLLLVSALALLLTSFKQIAFPAFSPFLAVATANAAIIKADENEMAF